MGARSPGVWLRLAPVGAGGGSFWGPVGLTGHNGRAHGEMVSAWAGLRPEWGRASVSGKMLEKEPMCIGRAGGRQDRGVTWAALGGHTRLASLGGKLLRVQVPAYQTNI